jgi:hypothetical protein
MLAIVIAFLVFTHVTGPFVGPVAVQVSAEMSDHQGYKAFAERARAQDVTVEAE